VIKDAYKQPKEDGNVYWVPSGAFDTYCLYYNKDVFEELGMDVPADWDSLLAVVEACQEKGIGAIGLADKDRWEGDLLYNMLVEREDADAFANAVADGGTFTGEAFVAAAEKVETLVNMGAFQNGYMQATTTECTELLKAGQIAMYPAGSWLINALQEEENIGYAVFPKTGAEDPYLSCCGGAADSGRVVSANSEHPDGSRKVRSRIFQNPE